jgi:hypothetical protein
MVNFPGTFRVVGESQRSARPLSTELELERAYFSVAKRLPGVTLCQYDVRRMSGDQVVETMKAHPDILGLHVPGIPV